PIFIKIHSFTAGYPEGWGGSVAGERPAARFRIGVTLPQRGVRPDAGAGRSDRSALGRVRWANGPPGNARPQSVRGLLRVGQQTGSPGGTPPRCFEWYGSRDLLSAIICPIGPKVARDRRRR